MFDRFLLRVAEVLKYGARGKQLNVSCDPEPSDRREIKDVGNCRGEVIGIVQPLVDFADRYRPRGNGLGVLCVIRHAVHL